MADTTEYRSGPPRLGRTIACGGLLVCSALIVAFTQVRTLRVPNVNAAPATQPVADAADRAARLHDVLGTFATGNAAGDRVITVLADGHVRFDLIGPLAGKLTITDTYQLAQHANHSWLVTGSSGGIEAVDIDHLSYCDDLYERTK